VLGHGFHPLKARQRRSIPNLQTVHRHGRIPAVGAPVGYVFYQAQLSPDNWVYQGGSVTNWKDGGVHGAPGPIAGAGLPILAVGYGAYWLVSRYRRKSGTAS
jgi:hypothetical protein